MPDFTFKTFAGGNPQLVALDWGTSSLRAFLMRDGVMLEMRQAPHGIQHLPAPGAAGFELALAGVVADWVQRWPELVLVASGMVGSAQGWREAPYVRAPASVHNLAERAVSVASGLGRDLWIAPGVILDEPERLPDVMRGEEIQVAGALLQQPAWSERACFVLPGTHSKWVQVEGGKILRFATYMTGEVFAVLRSHSILGRLMPESASSNADGFQLGIRTAAEGLPGDWLQQLFATRTLGLSGRLAAEALPDFLSGLLIGHEIVSGLARFRSAVTAPLVLIGDPALCARYQLALAVMSAKADAVLDNTAPTGLWNFACAAGLVTNVKPTSS